MYRNLYNSINGISTFFAFASAVAIAFAPFLCPFHANFFLYFILGLCPLQLQTEMEMGNGQAAAASAKRERKKPIYRLELEL